MDSQEQVHPSRSVTAMIGAIREAELRAFRVEVLGVALREIGVNAPEDPDECIRALREAGRTEALEEISVVADAFDIELEVGLELTQMPEGQSAPVLE